MQGAASNFKPENPFIAVNSQGVATNEPENPFIAVSSQGAATNEPENPFIAVSSQGAANLVSKQIPENPFIAVSAAALKPATVSTKDAVQPIPFSYSNNTTKNCKDENINKKQLKIKKDSMGITKTIEKIKKDCIAFTKTHEKIKKDCIAITKSNEKIKKDSIGITKINEKIKKDSIGITKTHEKNIKSKKEKIVKDSIRITKANEKIIKSKQEKIKKDSIGITKTYEKNTKSKKCFKKSKMKNKSMIKISRKVIQKKLKNKKISKKANVKIQKNPINIMFPKNQTYHEIDTKIRKKIKTKRDKVRELIISEPIDNIDKIDLTLEGVLENIMSKNGPHLWEKQLLEIVNQYDDKNNRARICAYRKAIVILQDRLHKRDDPHMIRVIIKKILRSYKKRLEVALGTLTSTPASSDDEDADNETANCFNLLSNRPPADYEVLRKADETHSVDTTENQKKMKKPTKKPTWKTRHHIIILKEK